MEMIVMTTTQAMPVGTKKPAQDKLRFFRRCQFSAGELSRVRTLLRDNGTTLILPYDQFIEHDSRHLEAASDAGNPDYILRLGVEGGYKAVAIHYGLTRRFWSKWEGQIPVLVKVNGKTSIPSDADALSVHTSFVEDAVRMGATAIGYTMYYGSPRQDDDLPQLAAVRAECEQYGMPLVVWAYPRGAAIDAKGGRDTNYAIESAVRMATEMGATIIKANLPKAAAEDFLTNAKVPAYYRELETEWARKPFKDTLQERANRVVQASQGIPVLFSGGSQISDEDLLWRAEIGVKAGAIGFIFGRNMWKRENASAMDITKKMHALLDTA
jgi:class I fructose-bisphosphate aldolase